MPFLGRFEQFGRVGSTNDIVRGWLADGVPEVCLANADEQVAGRGRSGRTWQAPAGSSVLLSLGFRPTWLAPERTWRLAAVAAIAMAGAAEEVAVLQPGTIRLKWPNDLVIEDGGPADPRAGTLRKLGGVLGETDGLGTSAPRAVVGIGLNADWPAAAFPPDLAAGMTSLAEVSGGRPIDRAALIDGFVDRLRPLVEALRRGSFAAESWMALQVTTGRAIRLETADGPRVVEAIGVDADSGALLVADGAAHRDRRAVLSGEVVHVRLVDAAGSPAATATGRV
ncbi:MAG TPA: biotin--[acetyl-CoA-carboxylase] ligase [Candidatus Binatia bacterium]|nr:biotin--[acetyl-CoA-carboxylase] ligase [Candidatus Binatia bacterium]